MTKKNDIRFEGFEKPDQNWFKMPKVWTTITRGIVSLAEIKVLEYLLCHTWQDDVGFVSKRISVSEFRFGIRNADGSRLDEGTGLSKQSVITGLKNAVKHGFVVQTIDNSDRARIKKSYQLRMRDESNHENVNLVDLVQDLDRVQVLDPVQDLDSRGPEVRPRSINGNGNGSTEDVTPVTVSQVRTNSESSPANARMAGDTVGEQRATDDSPLRRLPDNAIPQGQREHLVEVMLKKFGDVDNKPFYFLVAKKIDEQFIWQSMAEISQDENVRRPERVFAARVTRRAMERLDQLAAAEEYADYEKQRQETEILKSM